MFVAECLPLMHAQRIQRFDSAGLADIGHHLKAGLECTLGDLFEMQLFLGSMTMEWNVKTANDFMRRQLITLRPETSLIVGVARLLKENISGTPVIDARGIYLGVFSEKCCINALTETAECADQFGMQVPRVSEFMKSKLVTLTPNVDVFDAIDHLLAKHITGAPLLDSNGRFLGVFLEKTAMRVLISAAYDQLPGTTIAAYMNCDFRRVIRRDDSLIEIAHRFQQTPYRRLPVLHDEQLIGQVSRRDVIRSEYQLAHKLMDASKQTSVIEKVMDRNARTISSSDDILSIAQIFLNTPYRRLPVVESGRLVGQVSRCDLLAATAELLRPKAAHSKHEPLYLSPLTDVAPPSLG